ncbi:cytidine deaminase [Acidaminobacter sp. JC074]|uniref:cytidine deaminase n=1 Tax=Acidaminobacter sp. JC074 TaxID=2530199 RepID=UPI001F0D7CD6|nr:cytidine deaminase [Acidaminobacter sp. JC074]MCH4890010.1 cytidine deaminase [Acidaminobacter sp. JC074]
MLNKKDLELVEKARQVITENYDKVDYLHTVGAAVRCKNGKIYTGVNVYSLHGACAEQVAIGAAISNGEREFEAVVAVRGQKGEEVLPPCGNCRQMLADYMPKAYVIIDSKKGLIKVKAHDLLPFAYQVEA